MLNFIVGTVIGFYVGQKYSPTDLKEKAAPLAKQTVQFVKDIFK